MITFAHGCFGLWQKQSNQKGLTPTIGASPDFSARLKKVLSDSNNCFIAQIANIAPKHKHIAHNIKWDILHISSVGLHLQMEVRGVLDFHRILKLQIQYLVIVKAFHIVIYEYIAKLFRGVSMYGHNCLWKNMLNEALQ